MSSENGPSAARSPRRPWTTDAAWGLALTVAYYGLGKLGLRFAFENASATALWAPTGLAVAALLLLGLRLWPAVFAGAFLVNLTTQGTVLTSLGIATGNTLEGLAGAWLMARYAGGRRAFERARTFFVFVGLVALAAPLLSATVGLATLAAGGLLEPGQGVAVWLTWWTGDAVGALLVVPLLVLWANRAPWPHGRARAAEAVALGAAVVVAGVAIFGGFALPAPGSPGAFFTLPLLVWAAYRFGPRETATAAVLLSLSAVAGTLLGEGPFARAPANTALVVLQGFMGVAVLTGLGLAAVGEERRVAERALRAARDTLERRVAERTRSLDHHRAQLAEAESIAHLGSWEWDIPANAIHWSDELYRMYGQHRGTFAATFENVLALVHPEDRSMVQATIQRARADGQPFAFDHRILHPDGRERWFHGRGRVVHGPDGTPARMAGTAQDITERRAQETERRLADRRREEVERLRAVDAARRDFINTAAHELNTPLTPLRMQIHLLGSGSEPLSAAQRRSLDILDRNLERVQRLVQNMLDVARAQSGRMRLDVRPVDLRAVLAETVDAFDDVARGRGVALQLACHGPLPMQGDAARLGQVAFNLVSNALKFTPFGGRVRVAAAPERDRLVLRVSDTGVGLSEEQRARLFRPFAQLHESAPHAPRGSGLGLYITRTIVEAHGGRIDAASDGPGLGSTFTVELPPRPPAAGPPGGAPEPQAGEAA